MLIPLLVLGWLLLAAAKPFPHWPTFFRVVAQLLGNWRLRSIGPISRIRQLAGLIGWHVGLGPLWTVLWWLDELLYPAYRRAPIVAPIFVVSQPRSGTTLLHRALAQHDTLVALRTYEWQFPFITVQRAFAWLVRLSGGGVSRIDHFRGDRTGTAARMHRQRMGDYEEDGIFFEHVTLVHLFSVLRYPWPALFDVVDRVDRLSPRARARMLDVHAAAIRKVLWQRGGGTVLLKENESWLRQEDWLRRYPDARYVTVLRPVEAWMPSLLNLVRHSTRAKTGLDPWLIDGWCEALVDVKVRDAGRMPHFFDTVLPAHGSLQLRIRYDELIQGLAPTLERVAMELGIGVPGAFRESLTALAMAQADRPPDGRHAGLTPALDELWRLRGPEFARFEAFREATPPFAAAVPATHSGSRSSAAQTST